MGIIVDIIIVALIALSIFLGYKKGLVAIAVKLCAVVIALVVTLILYKPVSNFVINATSIDETVENIILEKAHDVINKEESQDITGEILENVEAGILPDAARELAINIVNVGVMIILFIAIRIGLIFVTALANLVAKLPILKQINELGGIVYGVLRGLLFVYIILFVISIFGQINPNNSIHKDITNSFIGKTMYEHNIINVFL